MRTKRSFGDGDPARLESPSHFVGIGIIDELTLGVV
jgi:hypothetical protein